MIWQKASTVFLENVEHWKRLKNNFETIFHEHYMFLTEKHERIKSVKKHVAGREYIHRLL